MSSAKSLKAERKPDLLSVQLLCYHLLRRSRLTVGSHARRDCLVVQLERKRVSPLLLVVFHCFRLLTRSSIPYNPVFFAYATVTPTTVELYIDDEKLTPEVKAHLGQDVIIKPYDSIFADAKALSESRKQAAGEEGAKFLLSNKASWALSVNLGGEEQVEEARSPIGDAKAVKNETELKGMRACHVRDGAALTEYFAWLEHELVNKKSTLDEVDAADKLEQIRSKNDLFAGLSFDTISSTGANAAVIHYKPEKGSCSIIDPNAIYLCDSGAQYLDGTTDVTRTYHFGKPTELEKKAFTLVLKGLISLDSAVFPKGTSGFALDVLARQFLWKEGLDYLHGTGHGVGSYLVSRRNQKMSLATKLSLLQNVHEGPMGIGTRVQYTEVPIAPGNVISDGTIPLLTWLVSLADNYRTWLLRGWQIWYPYRE